MFHSVPSPLLLTQRTAELELSQLAPPPAVAAMAPSCGAAMPYILLSELLRGGGSWPACGGRAFLRDYAQRGTNALLWAGLLAVTWVLLRRVAALLRLWALGSRIPGPPALLADPGLAAVCRAGGDITGYLSNLHGRFGPVVRLWVGPSQLLVSVKDSTLIKQVLAKAEDKLPLTERAYNLACGRLGLFISSFEKAKSSRKSLEVFLNEKFNVGSSGSSFKIIEAVLNRVDCTMDKDSLDCRNFSQHMTFNIIGAALFGEVFFDWSDAGSYEELLMIVAKDGCFWASYAVPPFWKSGYRKYRNQCAKLQILTEGIIRKSIDRNSLLNHNDPRSCNKSEEVVKEPVRCTSLLDGTKSAYCLHGPVEGPLSSQEEICGNIVGLMLHGISASANLVSSILARLVLYPNLKDQLYADIVAVCNQSSELEVDDVLRMQFLLATVCESARLLPAGPLLQRCSLQHDLTLKPSIVIPAGATLAVPLHLVQMDVSIWGHDACQFNPSRFLQNGVGLGGILAAHKGSDRIKLFTECDKTDSFLPFGSGSRACLGKKFAILGISMLIASLLLTYEVQPQLALTKEMDLSVDSNNPHHLPNPKIILTKRKI